jgi:hypothetical protein
LKINVKDVTYSGVGVDSKVYDGTTAALLNGTAAMATVTAGSSVSTDTKVITTDNVTLSGTVAGTFASKNVRGTDNAGANTVTLTGASLSGAEASNYNLVQQAPVTANGKITPQPLTLTGTTVADKTYDGTTSATVTNTGTLNGLVAGETLDVTATGTFNNASVGNQKPVTVTGALADRGGNLATNYRLANAQAIANITAALKPPSPVVPTDSTPRVKIPVGSANPFALASAEDLTDEACTANSIENCYCEPSPLNANVDICYEPKAGAKGAAH